MVGLLILEMYGMSHRQIIIIILYVCHGNIKKLLIICLVNYIANEISEGRKYSDLYPKTQRVKIKLF